MCNAYEQHVKWVEYVQIMQALELGIPTQQTELDLPESDDIRINDMAPVMRAAANGIELVPRRWLGDAVYFHESRQAYAALLDDGWTEAVRRIHPQKASTPFGIFLTVAATTKAPVCEWIISS